MDVDIKHIVCTADFSDYSEHAVSYGIELAKEFGAKLYFCYVIHISHNAVYSIAVSDSLERRTQLTKQVREHSERLIGDQSVNYEAFFTITNNADDIVRMAAEKKADLLVSTTQPRLSLKRFLLGSMAERLIQTLPFPLLFIRGPGRGYETSWNENIRFQRILVGCDFSPDSILGLRYALVIAQRFHSEVHLAFVCKPSDCRDLIETTTESKKELPQDFRNQISAKLTNLVPQEILKWCLINTEVLVGRPGEELTKYATANNVNLIVLGTRVQGLAEKPIKKSITHFVSQRSTCPILSVRPRTQGQLHHTFMF